MPAAHKRRRVDHAFRKNHFTAGLRSLGIEHAPTLARADRDAVLPWMLRP